METKLISALVAAGVSLALAIFSLISSRITKRSLLRIEEQSKRSEQIRLKATESGEKLLQYLTEVIISLESIKFHKKFEHKEGILESSGNLNQALSKVYRVNYETAIYTTSEIKDKVFETISPLLKNEFELTIKNIDTNIVRLNSLHDEIANMFKSTYLGSHLKVD
jgi:hypothetical protein